MPTKSNPSAVQFLQAEEFCQRVQDEVQAGRGYIPLLGAGLSAPAGIPTRADLILYLQLCVTKALGLDGQGQPSGDRWHPRRNAWPVMRGDWASRARDGVNRLRSAIHFETTPTDEKLILYQNVCRQAYGALADWRLTLQFLSRIRQSEVNQLQISTNNGESKPSYQVSQPYTQLPEAIPGLKTLLNRLLDPSDTESATGHDSKSLPILLQAECPDLIQRAEALNRIADHATQRVRELNVLAETLGKQVANHPPILLGEIDANVIDSFFNHLVGEKSPAMGHRLVVHLASVLRTKLILTLNFDDLLEQAFREHDIEPVTFDIHQQAGLPPWELLGNQPVIIKLHGGRYGLRADLSLDQEPSEKDKATFNNYFLGQDHSLPNSSPTITGAQLQSEVRSHLLVAGVSCQDVRVRALVSSALNSLPQLKVFWCCYSQQDEDELDRYFGNGIPTDRLFGVRHAHLGFLLWEVYQRVTRCLPPGGLEFPTAWQIPTPPRLLESEDLTVRDRFKNKLLELSIWPFSEKQQKGMILESPKTYNSTAPAWGVTALGWLLFQSWAKSSKCVWLEAEELAGCDELKVRLLQAVASIGGQGHQKPPVNLLEDRSHERFVDEFRDLIQASGQRWVLFLYLRGSPGYYASQFRRLTLSEEERYPDINLSVHDWIAERRAHWEWEPAEHQRVAELIERLARELPQQLAIVILRREHEFPVSRDLFETHTIDTPVEATPQHWADIRSMAAIQWMREEGEEEAIPRARLLRALLLFEHACHHTALVSRSVLTLETGSPQQWLHAWTWADKSLKALRERKIVRQKPGGFLWMHWEMREHLLYHLLKTTEGQTVHNSRDTIHIGIADWYMTFFAATGDPLAVFQTVYHRCRVAGLNLRKDTPALLLVRARGAICEASNHLEAARANVLARGHPLDTEKCLDGYFDFLCSLLERTRKTPRTEDPVNQMRNLRFLVMVKVKGQLYRIWFCRDLGKTDRVIRHCSELRDWRAQWSSSDPNLWDGYRRDWNDEAFWNENALEWEAAVARVSLRCYASAEQSFREIESEFGFPVDEVQDASSDTAVWQAVDTWIHAMGGSDHRLGTHRYAARRFLVHVLRRHIELLLLRAEVDFGLSKNMSRIEVTLRQAQMLYLAAQMLPRYVTVEENSQLRIEHSRLHSAMAGIFALLGDHQGVYRQLNEAVVALGSLPKSEDPIAHIVVDLRRIYCHLAQLMDLPNLQRYRSQLLKHGLRSDPKSLETRPDVRKAEAILLNSHQLLDDVERRIRRNRKSLWWWMTHARYRMVCLEYTELLHLWRTEAESQPFDSLSSDETGEVAHHLMEQVARRVIFDSFQFSRIAHSYCNIARMSVLTSQANVIEKWSKSISEVRRCLDEITSRRDRLFLDWDRDNHFSWDCKPDQLVKDYTLKIKARLDQFLDTAPPQ